jgi:hypothetical protein
MATEIVLVSGASAINTDGTLAANSDTVVPSQKAVKTYVDANAGGGGTDVSAWPVFVGSYNGTTQEFNNNAGFSRILLPTITVDTHNGWDSTNNWWTVPTGQSGRYRIEMKYRLSDEVPGGISHGIGAGTSQGDSPAFFWATTIAVGALGSGANRHGVINQRIVSLNAGDQVRLFCYIDSNSVRKISDAEMTIDRIR